MPIDRVPSLCRILSSSTVDQLSRILQQTAEAITPSGNSEAIDEALIFTETGLPANGHIPEQLKRFVAVVSAPFSGLLLAYALPSSADSSVDNEYPFYRVELTFNPADITAFLQELGDAMRESALKPDFLEAASRQVRPNDAVLQSEFTLRLIDVLAGDQTNQSATSSTANTYSACDQAVEMALRQQIEQERSLNQVATQIRQSMDLPVILQTAVQQVQQLLQVDRAIIYEFESAAAHNQGTAIIGRVTYEAIATDTLPSVLNLAEEAYCFTEVPGYQDKYRKGQIFAIDDIESTFAFSPCLMRLLQRAKVRAKLIAPIVVQEEPWGLLIAHQCLTSRQWQEREKTFLQRIAEHLAIAISQASLYAQLQQQKQTLEQRVIERTQALHDTLTAAQSASLAKTEFLAAMSHELRTPLTCIIGMTNTLLRLPLVPQTEQILSPERQRDYLSTIQRSGEQLLQLINDILDLSEVEAGRTILDIQEFSLSHIARESLQVLKDKADQSGVQLHLDLQIEPAVHDGTFEANNPSAILDRFTADAHRVKQILLNLLSNAIKFTPAGGQVMLRVWREQNTAVFQIEDTGIGIPESQRSLLFQKFQQLDMSHHRRYEGTGLGLALTKQLVELHRGWIELESVVNVGSTFTVWLPAQPLDAIKPRAAIASSKLQGRIVLIENDEATATLICDLLTTAGYQVIWMVSGSGVIPQIEILQPLSVILSSQLTGMGAYEILHSLRQNPVTQTIRVLVLAVATVLDNSDHWLASGADDYLMLPIDQPEQLLTKVTALMVMKRKA